MQPSGGRIFMTKSMLLLIGLFFAVPLEVAGAQTVNQGTQAVPGNQGLIGTPTVQSISPARSPCGAGSQSVRVCNNDFQSCNSACSAAIESNTSADITGSRHTGCTPFIARH